VGCGDAADLDESVNSESAAFGEDFYPTAHVTDPSGNSAPEGTVTFKLYAKDDPGCLGAPIATATADTYESDDAISEADGEMTAPDAFGTYPLTATYGGDDTFAESSSNCGDATLTVTKATPGLGVSPPTRAYAGYSTSASTAIYKKRAGAPAPTGSVTFDIYGPDDLDCSTPPMFSSTSAVTTNSAGDASATSDPFTPPSTGTYRVVDSYSGDDNYAPASDSAACDPYGNEDPQHGEFEVWEAPLASLMPQSLTFGSADSPQALGTIGPPQELTLTNTGGDGAAADFDFYSGQPVGGYEGLTVSSVRLSNASDFLISSNDCPKGTVLHPNETCTIAVRFTPQATGTRTGTLTVTTNDPNGPVTANLSGSAAPGAGTGTNGTNGTSGTNGADGAQGPKGDTGPAGPAGPAGRDGTNSPSAYYYCQQQELIGVALRRCARAIFPLSFNPPLTPKRACTAERKHASKKYPWSKTLYRRCIRAGTAYQSALRS
jgi:hypothetical protein